MRKKFPTSTITSANEIVPWLSASGPLAYTPENPPSRDYYFQYGWILPGIFAEASDRKQHRFFGKAGKDTSLDVFNFWRRARAGKANRIAFKVGSITPVAAIAPLAVYEHELFGRGEPGLMMVQHGSYQPIHRADQPEISRGMIHLYRGIQKATTYRYMKFDPQALVLREKEAWAAHLKTQGQVLSDSVLSFNSIHDRTCRSETTHIRDRGSMTDDIAKANGLEIEFGKNDFAATLWDAHHQCWGLEQWVAERKFGPAYIVAKTPVGNIRITTYFAGETECKVIDPNRVEIVKTVGCGVEYVRAVPALRGIKK